MKIDNNYKKILITVASNGIGKELSIQYANKDTTLFLIGRNKERLLKTKELCENKGAKVIYEIIDIKNKEELKNTILNFDKTKNIDLINIRIKNI